MDRLIHTAVSGLNASMVRQRIIASNMANAQTIGFRAEVMRHTPTTIAGASLKVRAMARSDVHGALMKPGAMIRTGRELDVALAGDALLTVQARDGSEAYTRRGDLAISATGVLENGEGRPVIGEGGPITVPAGAKVSIAPDGGLMVSDPATPDLAELLVDLSLRTRTGRLFGGVVGGDVGVVFDQQRTHQSSSSTLNTAPVRASISISRTRPVRVSSLIS